VAEKVAAIVATAIQRSLRRGAADLRIVGITNNMVGSLG